MKYRFKLIAVVILILLVLVCGYQIYWLINFYQEQYKKTETVIDSIVSESTYKELGIRVSLMTSEQNQWREANQNNSEQESTKPYPDESSFHLGLEVDSVESTNSSDLLSEFLRMDFMMKQGLFSAVNIVKPVNIARLDSILSADLSVFDVSYILECRRSNDSTLIFEINHNNIPTSSTKEYILSEYNDNKRDYRLYIQSHKWHTFKNMWILILVTASIITLLIISYLYLLKIILRQKTVDEIKSDFINNMTHELKTPISVTYAAVDAMQNFGLGEDSEKRNKYLSISKEQLMYLNSLVEQILTMSVEERKNMKLSLSSIRIYDIFDKQVKKFELNTSKPVTFSMDVQPENLTIQADVLHFENVISNLIENAIKYSNDTVDIKLSAYTSDKGKVISVCDNGIGIPQNSIDKIFDKFYRVSTGNIHNVKGYGLGLFYVKTITDKHGWDIEVKSKERTGTCFKIIIP